MHAFMVEINQMIKDATEELKECRLDDKDSFASGYETGYIAALKEIKDRMFGDWEGAL